MKKKDSSDPILVGLDKLAEGRDHITTEEFSRVIGRAQQTIRKLY